MPDDPTPARGGAIPKTRSDDARGTPPGRGMVTAPNGGGRIGNPPFVATDEQRKRVRELAKVFPAAGRQMIARLMGFSVATLDRHFADEMELGRAELAVTIGTQMINRAINVDAVGADGKPLAKGDLKAMEFVLTHMCGWTKRVEVTGRGGGPIRTETVDLTRLSEAQLREYGRLAAIAEGLDPDALIATTIG